MYHKHKIFVDADACPVKQEIYEIANEYKIEVLFVASFAHLSNKQLGTWKYIEQSQDGVDFYIFKQARENDIVVTQDMGLASLLLSKGVQVISTRGDILHEHQMDSILFARHQSAKMRRAGKHTKGPKPFTNEQRVNFIKNFQHLLSNKKGIL